MSDGLTCDYCDGNDLVYELRSDRGPVKRCIPCLAIEQGQPKVSWERFQDYPEDLQKHTFQNAHDWLRILARIVDDDAIIKRDPDAIGTVSEGTREFLTNIMGSDAHYPPSEVAGSEVDVAQTTFGEVSDDDE